MERTAVPFASYVGLRPGFGLVHVDFRKTFHYLDTKQLRVVGDA